MGPKRNLQQQRDDQNDALRDTLAEFQIELRNSLQQVAKQALQAVL